MRSLYVDDIPGNKSFILGAQPTKRVYDKRAYLEKHN